MLASIKAPPEENLFNNERPLIIRGPLPSVVFNSVGHLFQHKVPLIELARAHLLVKRVLYPFLIQAPMAHGR